MTDDEVDRLARALVDELQHTAPGSVCAQLVDALTFPYTKAKAKTRADAGVVLRRDPEWRALVRRACEVAGVIT